MIHSSTKRENYLNTIGHMTALLIGGKELKPAS
jgi:hypothetical protein